MTIAAFKCNDWRSVIDVHGKECRGGGKNSNSSSNVDPDPFPTVSASKCNRGDDRNCPNNDVGTGDDAFNAE